MKKHEQIIIQRNPNQPKIICNKVAKRYLKFSESVELGLEPEPYITDFIIIKELGRGSFGKVFLATHKNTKVNYALKVIDKNNKHNEEKPYIEREIEIMYTLKHPNCIRLYGNFEDDSFFYFIMEYAPKGNLYNLIRANKNEGLDKVLVANMMKDIISAVHYLHNMNPPIIHRDIKPENILLTKDNKVRLTDFGWANYLNLDDEQRTTLCGTPLYLAPEMIERTGHGKNVDIWCLGVLLFELLVGKPPFSGGNNKDLLIKNILRVKILWPKYPQKEIDKDAKDLISKILKYDPQQRISIEEMIKHPFFVKNCSEQPINLDNIPQYYHKPFIISKDIPNEENDNYITEKKVNTNDNFNDISKDKNNYSPRFPRKKKKIINIINNNKKKLITNKSAINLFPKKLKPYKKKNYGSYLQNSEYDELIKKLEEYQVKDNEKNKEIVLLLSKNKTLTEENLLLKNKLKEKQEELQKQASIIKKLKSPLLSRNKIIKINNNNFSDNENLSDANNSFFRKANKYTSKTPYTSPLKYKKIQINPKTPKNLSPNKIFTNNNLNLNDTGKTSQENYLQNGATISSTNISSLDPKEIVKLKMEFYKEKEKYEIDINNYKKEIMILQYQNKRIQEKDNNEIIKLTRNLTKSQKEIQSLKAKIKELIKSNEYDS